MAGGWAVEVAGGDSARIPDADRGSEVEMLIPVRINSRGATHSTPLKIKAKCVSKTEHYLSRDTKRGFRGQFVASVGDQWDAGYESEILLGGNLRGRTEVISWREGREPTIMIQTSDDPRDFELYLYTTFRRLEEGDPKLSEVSIEIEVTYPKDLSNENKGEVAERAVVEFSEDDGTIFWREEIFGRPLLSELAALNPTGPGYSIHPKSLSTARLVREVFPKLARSRKRPLNIAYIGLDTSENIHAVLRVISELQQADDDVRIGTFRIVYTSSWDARYKEDFEEDLRGTVEGLGGRLEWTLSLEDEEGKEIETVDLVVSTFVCSWAFPQDALRADWTWGDLKQVKYLQEIERNLGQNGVLIVVDPAQPEEVARGGGSQRTQQITQPYLFNEFGLVSLKDALEESGWPEFSTRLSVIENVCCIEDERASIIEELTEAKVPTEGLMEEYRRLALTKGRFVNTAGRPADIEELARPILMPVELSKIREEKADPMKIIQNSTHLMERFAPENKGRANRNLASLYGNFRKYNIDNEKWGDCWESMHRPNGDQRLGFPKAEQGYKDLEYDPDSLRQTGAPPLSETGFTILKGDPAVGKSIAMRKLWIEGLRIQDSSKESDEVSLFVNAKDLDVRIVDGRKPTRGHAAPGRWEKKTLMIGGQFGEITGTGWRHRALLREIIGKSLSSLDLESSRVDEIMSADGHPEIKLNLYVDGLDEIANRSLRDVIISMLSFISMNRGGPFPNVRIIASIRNAHWRDYLENGLGLADGAEQYWIGMEGLEGEVYTGQSSDVPRRLEQHVQSGRYDPGTGWFERIRELEIIWSEETLHKELPVKLFKSWGDDMSGHIGSFMEWAEGVEAEHAGWIGTPLRMSWLCRFAKNGKIEDFPLDILEFEIIRWAARDAIERRTRFSTEGMTDEQRDELLEDVLFLVAGMISLSHRWFDNPVLDLEAREMSPEQRLDLVSFMVREGWGKNLLESLTKESVGQYHLHGEEAIEFSHLQKLLFDDFTLMYIVDEDKITWTHESFKETLLAWLLTHERYDEVRRLLIRYEEQYNGARWYTSDDGHKKYYISSFDEARKLLRGKVSPIPPDLHRRNLESMDRIQPDYVNGGWIEIAMQLGEPPERFSEAFVPTLKHLVMEMGANSFETVRRALLWDSEKASNEYIIRHPLVNAQVPYLTNGLVRLFNSITTSEDVPGQSRIGRRRKKTLCEHLWGDKRFQFDWSDEQTYHEIQKNIAERGSRIHYLLGYGNPQKVSWDRIQPFLEAVKKFDSELDHIGDYDKATEWTYADWGICKGLRPAWDERGVLEGVRGMGVEKMVYQVGDLDEDAAEDMCKKFDFQMRYLAHYCLPIQSEVYSRIYAESDWQPGPNRLTFSHSWGDTGDWWKRHGPDTAFDEWEPAGGWIDSEGEPDWSAHSQHIADILDGTVIPDIPEAHIIPELDLLFEGFDWGVGFFRWLLSQFVIAENSQLMRLGTTYKTNSDLYYDKLSGYIWPKYGLLGRYLFGKNHTDMVADNEFWKKQGKKLWTRVPLPTYFQNEELSEELMWDSYGGLLVTSPDSAEGFMKVFGLNFAIDFWVLLQTMNETFHHSYISASDDHGEYPDSGRQGGMPLDEILDQDDFFGQIEHHIYCTIGESVTEEVGLTDWGRKAFELLAEDTALIETHLHGTVLKTVMSGVLEIQSGETHWLTVDDIPPHIQHVQTYFDQGTGEIKEGPPPVENPMPPRSETLWDPAREFLERFHRNTGFSITEYAGYSWVPTGTPHNQMSEHP